MQQNLLMAVLWTTLLIAAACGRSPEEQARAEISEIMDTVENEIEQMHALWQEIAVEVRAEEEKGPDCYPHFHWSYLDSTRRNFEDDEDYLAKTIPCARSMVLKDIARRVDRGIAETQPEVVLEIIRTGREQLNNVSESEILVRLGMIQSLVGDRNLQSVETWHKNLPALIDRRVDRRMRLLIKDDDVFALYEARKE